MATLPPVFHLLAAQLHEDVAHDALPLAPERAVLQGVQEVQVLLDEEAQRAGKRPAGGDTKPRKSEAPRNNKRSASDGHRNLVGRIIVELMTSEISGCTSGRFQSLW